MIGTTLSHFKITAKLGEGGMGEVYRAEDTKLGREVALKVLPEAFAQDHERMARFAREAQVLASLNHANIAAIYGLEEDADRHALVMELVEGETLQQRIARGPVSLAESARIGLEIARAMETAHEKGIVHRDLKPANIKITPEGQVKVLDFGLAKALEEEHDPANIANSPTLTAAATQAGIILGTAAYMSPEQAAGSMADRRSDIWSYGVVLSELLTGRQQFAGETVSHTLASVLKDEPEWERFPKDLPPRILDLLQRCLRKDAKQRLQAIGDARVVWEEYLADPEAFEAPVVEAATVGYEPLPTWKRLLPWAVAVALAVALVGLGGTLIRLSRKQPERPIRAMVELPKTLEVFGGYGSSVAISPDGSTAAFVMEGGGELSLYLRPFDRWEPELVGNDITGSDSPYHPFFSPDGKWLGFVTPTELKKVPVQGGAPITLCGLQLSRGASWGPDGTIVFAPSPTSGLSRVPAAGGEPEPLTELADGEATHRWPQVLPGGEAVLFTTHTRTGDFNEASIELVDLGTRERTVLHRGGSYGRYIESGHIVYVRNGTLFAIPFDLGRLTATGSAFPVLEGVGFSSGQGGAHFDVSADGRLLYVEGGGESPGWEGVWVDREGVISPLWEEERLFRYPRLSPDGRFLVVDVFNESDYDLWIYEIDRGIPTRLTFSESEDTVGVWSPDSASLVFSSDRNGNRELYRKAADGSGDVEQLTDNGREKYPWSISPDGRMVAYHEMSDETGWDLWMLPLDGEGEPQRLLATEFNESEPSISPDGRWISYDSDESGTWEVYVRPADGSGGKWQISTGGGSWSFWAREGRELYYASPAGAILRVEVEASGGSIRASRPVEVVAPGFVSGGTNVCYYHVEGEAERFVVFRGRSQISPEAHSHALLILNWFEEIQRAFEN